VGHAATDVSGDQTRVISNGTTTVHRFALDPFVILITAEPNANVTRAGTRVVLRAGSPSTRLLPQT